MRICTTTLARLSVVPPERVADSRPFRPTEAPSGPAACGVRGDSGGVRRASYTRGEIYTSTPRTPPVNRGWLLFAASALLAAVAVVVGVFAFAAPPLFLAAIALGAGSYGCWTRARERIVADVYDRVGVEPNADGTVGTEASRSRTAPTGRVTHEPRDDWDDPEDWPFDDPFWRVTDAEAADHPGAGGDPDAGDDATRGSDAAAAGESSAGHARGDGPTADAGSGGPREAGRWWRDRGGDGGGGAAATPGGASGGELQVLAPREREACEVLGIDVDADVAAIRTAYRERAKETHPDHGGTEAAFKRVRWAYEYLRANRE